MANSTHVAILCTGAARWNRWRRENPHIQPDLSTTNINENVIPIDKTTPEARYDFSNSQLSGCTFQKVDLHDCHFEHANLSEANFINCDLSGAHFEDSLLSGSKFIGEKGFKEAKFNRATLKAVSFRTVCLRSVAFDVATLGNVDFTDMRLTECTFRNAQLLGCICQDATFDYCDFRDADLSRSNFVAATFRQVDLARADLTGVDLRGASGYQFDDNHAFNVILSPGSVDGWSTLRRAYTGARFAFNILFLVFFFAPIVVKAVLWTEVQHLQTASGDLRTRMKQAADTLSAAPDPIAHAIGSALAEFSSRGPCLAEKCDSVRLVWLLLGLNTDWHDADCLTRIAIAAGPLLIIYNGLRGFLTLLVAPLRDEEERSGHTPRRALWRTGEPRKPPLWERLRTSYGWMTKLHWIVQVLQYVAYGSTAVSIFNFLSTEVSLPARH
jgi:uncharacterized protein YjbI with pentapeptide repeats